MTDDRSDEFDNGPTLLQTEDSGNFVCQVVPAKQGQHHLFFGGKSPDRSLKHGFFLAELGQRRGGDVLVSGQHHLDCTTCIFG